MQVVRQALEVQPHIVAFFFECALKSTRTLLERRACRTDRISVQIILHVHSLGTKRLPHA